CVHGSSPSDVFGVGDNGTIVHYDGGAWSLMTSSTASHLTMVFAVGDDVFAGGRQGKLLRYRGTAVDALASTTTQNLEAVWGASSHDAYAVGASGTLLHFDGN